MKQIDARQLENMGLSRAEAEAVAGRLCGSTGECGARECWSRISREILKPDHSFDAHKFVYDAVFSGWDPAKGPRPAWTPLEEEVGSSNIGRLMVELGMDSYADLHAWSVADRAEFWDRMIGRVGIRFNRQYSRVMDLSENPESPAWLIDAEFNIADSCFVSPRDSAAIIYQPEGGAISRWSYGELEALSNRVANGLKAAGYARGDALACYMPMTAESVAIYLGVVKAGCVVVSVADSFAPAEVAKRLEISGAKAVFTQDFMLRGGKRLPLYEKVVEAGARAAIVIPAVDSGSVDLRGGDVWWADFLSGEDEYDSVKCSAADHTNILFSSGTTGDPKAIPWTQVTPIKCVVDGYLHHDIRPGDVVAWPTNLGWMMGPWLIYASLANRATIALYYGAPTGGDFARFVQDAGVNMLGVVPSLVKAWRNSGCVEGLDWTAVRAFSSTGECSNADDMLYLMSLAGYRPVIEYCGGTEIGGGYITGTVVQSASPATFSTPALGLDFVLVDESGGFGYRGEVFLMPPSIGLSNELMNRDHHEVYYEGAPRGPNGELLRRHGDEIERLGAGYYRAHGRADDTMNLGGIKVSSAEIERTLNRVEGVNETAAVAVAGEGGGPGRLVVYAVCIPGAETDSGRLAGAMQAEIKKHLNPLFKIHDVVVVDSLPRTASNKVMHRKLREEYGQNRL